MAAESLGGLLARSQAATTSMTKAAVKCCIVIITIRHLFTPCWITKRPVTRTRPYPSIHLVDENYRRVPNLQREKIPSVHITKPAFEAHQFPHHSLIPGYHHRRYAEIWLINHGHSEGISIPSLGSSRQSGRLHRRYIGNGDDHERRDTNRNGQDDARGQNVSPIILKITERKSCYLFRSKIQK